MAGSTGSTKWKTFNAARSTSAGKRRQATAEYSKQLTSF